MRPAAALRQSPTVPVLVTLERAGADGGIRPLARLSAAARLLLPRRVPADGAEAEPIVPLARPLTDQRCRTLLCHFRTAAGGPVGSPRRASAAPHGPDVRYFPNLGMLAGVVDASGLKWLQADPGVAAIDVLPALMPIAPFGPERRSLRPAARVTWGIRRMRIEALWRTGLSGAGVRVGHLDTGVDGSHPAFPAGAIAAFTVFDSFGRQVGSGGSPTDTATHGTQTAGTIVGRGVDGRHVGIAPGASLASAVVIEGGRVIDRVLAGIDWSLAQGVRIVNVSLGLPGRVEALERLVERLRQLDVLPVVAVGNEGPGTSRSPGNAPAALSVGALDRRGGVDDLSSSERFLRATDPGAPDLVAPGVQVQSAAAGGGWIIGAGTSLATPHVSGLAALLWEARPTAGAAEIEAAILGSCDPSGIDPSRGGAGVPDGPRAYEMLTGTSAALAAPRRRLRGGIGRSRPRRWRRR
jgi:subtilisin